MPPNEWVSEGPAIIATYGLGLQGWDFSYEFSTWQPGFSSCLASVWDVGVPGKVGLYPALARMVYRNDVQEEPRSSWIARSVFISKNGPVKPLGATIAQSGDIKEKSPPPSPSEALAIGPRGAPNLPRRTSRSAPGFIPVCQGTRSSLPRRASCKWHYPSHDEAYFTINTPGTKALNRIYAQAGIYRGRSEVPGGQ